MLATQSEAHAEWHLNSGTRIWVDSGCPWDACGLADDDYPEEEEEMIEYTIHVNNGIDPAYYFNDRIEATEAAQRLADSGGYHKVTIKQVTIVWENVPVNTEATT